MTDEKNQGGGSAGTAAERLAKQRKALNLQTQPLEVIADLDWDVDDDDAEFTLPTPVTASKSAAPKPAESKTAAPKAEEKAPAAVPKADEKAPVRTSTGTMAMSAGDFAEAMRNEGIETGAADAAPKPSEDTAQTRDTAKHEATRAQSSGGTMLLSGDAMQEAMEAAKLEAESTGAEHRETAPHSAVETSEQSAQPTRSAGGTMLMSADTINEKLEEQIREAEATTQPSDGGTTGSVADASTPGHEPQTPDWDQEEPARDQVEWTAPDAAGDVSKASGFLAGLSPNVRVLLAIAGILLLVIILWLILA